MFRNVYKYQFGIQIQIGVKWSFHVAINSRKKKKLWGHTGNFWKEEPRKEQLSLAGPYRELSLKKFRFSENSKDN
jgi:hypothetical protein